MRWRDAISAALKRPWRLDCQDHGLTFPHLNAGGCLFVQSIKTKSTPAVIVPLERRAVILNNRNRVMVERYLLVHQILSRGR